MKRYRPSLERINEVNTYLRPASRPWELATRKRYHNKCVLTGQSNGQIDVHHPHISFRDIVTKAHIDLSIEYKYTLDKYSNEELKALYIRVEQIHFETGLGVTIAHYLHKKLHQLTGGGYGVRYEQFVKEYKRIKQTRGRHF